MCWFVMVVWIYCWFGVVLNLVLDLVCCDCKFGGLFLLLDLIVFASCLHCVAAVVV